VVPPPKEAPHDEGPDVGLIAIGTIAGVIVGGPLIVLLICVCIDGCLLAYGAYRARKNGGAPVAPYCDAPQAPGGKGESEGGGGVKDIELAPLVQKPVEAVVRENVGTVEGSGWVYDEAFHGSWFVCKH